MKYLNKLFLLDHIKANTLDSNLSMYSVISLQYTSRDSQFSTCPKL